MQRPCCRRHEHSNPTKHSFIHKPRRHHMPHHISGGPEKRVHYSNYNTKVIQKVSILTITLGQQVPARPHEEGMVSVPETHQGSN